MVSYLSDLVSLWAQLLHIYEFNDLQEVPQYNGIPVIIIIPQQNYLEKIIKKII